MCKDSQVRFNFGTFALIYMYFSPSFAYEGSCDCGLFAIVFATALVMGHKPEDVQFNQGKMRKHLWKCLGKKTNGNVSCDKTEVSEKSKVCPGYKHILQMQNAYNGRGHVTM